jgi:hypothetical protein
MPIPKPSLSQTALTKHPPALALFISVICFLVSFGAFVSGTLVRIKATRITRRITEEVLETRGVVTSPVTCVVQECRVDIQAERKILGLIPWSSVTLEDVIEAGTSSGTTTIRNSPGHRTSSYGTEELVLKTRAGNEWRSEPASGLIGTPPSEAAEELRGLIDGSSPASLACWWIPWLNNTIGIPFALAGTLAFWGLVMSLLQPSSKRSISLQQQPPHTKSENASR